MSCAGWALSTALLLAASALVVPSPAWAQAGGSPAPRAGALEGARSLAAQALKLYEGGQYAAAIELFEKADALYPAPQYRVYEARAQVKIGKLRRAVARYTEAVQMKPPAGAQPSFREAQKTAADELAETERRIPMLRIEVIGAPAQNVALTVDGERVPASEWSHVPLEPGRHRVSASAPGLVGGAREVDLREGATESVALTLLAPAPPGLPGLRVGGFASLGVGGAGLLVAAVTGGLLAGKRSSIEAACPNMLCTPAGRALIDSTGPLDAANVVGWTVGLAGLAAGVVMLVVGRDRSPAISSRSTPLVRVAPAVVPGGAGVSVGRAF